MVVELLLFETRARWSTRGGEQACRAILAADIEVAAEAETFCTLRSVFLLREMQTDAGHCISSAKYGHGW